MARTDHVSWWLHWQRRVIERVLVAWLLGVVEIWRFRRTASSPYLNSAVFNTPITNPPHHSTRVTMLLFGLGKLVYGEFCSIHAAWEITN
jgi:hypothetical protein